MATCVDFLDRRGYYRNLLPIYDQLTHAWGLDNPDDAKEQRNLGWAWARLGNLYHLVARYQASTNAHKAAQTLFNNIDFSEGRAAYLSNLGLAYKSLGQYEQAIEFYQQSLEIQREIGDRRGKSSSLSLNNLGNAYSLLGHYERAIEFHQQSLEIQREIGDCKSEAGSLCNLGNACDSLGHYERAIEFHQQSLEIYGAKSAIATAKQPHSMELESALSTAREI